MEELNSLFTCELEKCDRYPIQEPISLPCGHMTCKDHLKNGPSFTCPRCHRSFKMPQEGFHVSKLINALMNQNVHLANQQKKARKVFQALEKEVQEIFKMRKNLIALQMSTVRENIAKHMNTILTQIEQSSEAMLTKLDALESEWIQQIDFRDRINMLGEELSSAKLQDDEICKLSERVNSLLAETRERGKQKVSLNKDILLNAVEVNDFGRLVINNPINQEEDKFVGHTDRVCCIQQIDNFAKIVTSSLDKSIRIWSTESGNCLRTLKGTVFAISDDQRYHNLSPIELAHFG
jgi:hypothetical protein